MRKFSERAGKTNIKSLQFDDIDRQLRMRMLNFINAELNYLDDSDTDSYEKIAYNIITDFFVVEYSDIYSQIDSLIRQHCHNADWYLVYDLLEHVYSRLMKHYENVLRTNKEIVSKYGYRPDEYYKIELTLDKITKIDQNIKDFLEKENSGYRLIKGKLVPITNEFELACLDDAMNSDYNTVNVHLEKALRLYSDRERPDYKNSIKESITAVEAISKIITQKDNKTLKPALDTLSHKGVEIHGALKEGFKNLYGFTSDENGIRHAKIEFVESPSEDAKFMLVSCSAFINYLIEKNAKVNQNLPSREDTV